MEKWTMEILEKYTLSQEADVIKATGSGIFYINSKGQKVGKFDINFSDILSRLIKEAGRLCDKHASDLFISWQGIEKKLKDYDFGSTPGGKFLFGFREEGVDHTDWVLTTLNIWDNYYCYRSLWLLDIKIGTQMKNLCLSGGYTAEVTMTLKKIQL